jgi:hypothetical protein
MQQPVKAMSMGALLCLLAVSPVITSGTHTTADVPKYAGYRAGAPVTIAATAAPVVIKSATQLLEEEATGLYQSMNLKKFGLSRKAFEYAWRGYKQLLQNKKICKDQVLSICDFSQSSRRKRFYIIDVESKKILINTWVAHGRNSGGEYARAFSNKPESHQSSLGFYVTRNTYYGGHGLALKIEGLEKNINDLADERNIVIHGSNYVGASFLRQSRINGRSFGCPAVPAKENAKVIQTIKGGSCLFIYHPTKTYIQNSKVLNG